jgi:hypothetical protein
MARPYAARAFPKSHAAAVVVVPIDDACPSRRARQPYSDDKLEDGYWTWVVDADF